MIINRNNKSYEVYTEGFGVSFPEPFSIKMDIGKFCIFNSDGEKFTHYPEIEFDVVADDEFDVLYDVYLLVDGNIQVDRSELGSDMIAGYSGEVPLRHTILTFILPANTTSLDDVQIRFNNVEVILP